MGLFDSLFGSKNKTKSSSQVDPWDEATKYLLGNDTTKGVFPSAQNLFATGGFTPQMQDANSAYLSMLQNRGDGSMNPAFQGNIDPQVSGFLNNAAGDLGRAAYDVAGGAFDTNFSPVANTTASMVNLNQARAGQGALNPTNAMSRLLSGTPDTRYLDQQANAITNQLTNNMMKNVMPGIRSGAIASGQYGGSRQGIAEGNAISNLNQDLAPSITGMYAGALENAQQRMYGTANALNDQAFQNANNNAGRDMATQQFNANLGLQNNQQQMAKNQSNLGNRMNALDIVNGGLGLLGGAQQLRAGDQSLALQGALGSQQVQGGSNALQDQNFGQMISALGLPQDINWQNLNNYAGIMFPGAQLGNQSQGKNVSTSSPGIVPAALGTLSGIGGLMQGFGKSGGGIGGGGSGFMQLGGGGINRANSMFL